MSNQGSNNLGLSNIDAIGFTAELDSLRAETIASLSQTDYKHLLKIQRYGRLATLLGYSTAWIIPNPVSALGLGLGQFTRWLLAHHILHKGYDKVPGIPAKYTSKVFARGWRRFIDWFDWLHPEAWDYEHNILHHYNTGEEADPDMTERHIQFLREAKLPLFIKYIFVLIASLTWKFTYYAPNTMSVLDPETKKRLKHEHIVYITVKSIFNFSRKAVRDLWLKSYIPYAGFNFVIIPALFLPLGETAALFVFINKLLAEGFTNWHSFLVIGPNHTADDIYRFDFHYKNKAEHNVMQVLSSCNYKTGDEFTDYMSIWLNYQIEHHLFPDLPMLKYREIQPKVKAICLKYGLPYRQESIFTRFRKMLKVVVGTTSLIRLKGDADSVLNLSHHSRPI